MHESRTISLNGPWRFALDPEGRAAWFSAESPVPPGEITVPGSWEEQGYGEPPRESHIGGWTKRREYVGPAWYVKEIAVPEAWQDSRVELVLSGVRWMSEVFLDGRSAGTNESLIHPHRFDLTPLVRWGKPQKLAVRVDSGMMLPLEESHIHSVHTATLWGGITGGAALVRSPQARLGRIAVCPDAADRRVTFAVEVEGKAAEAAGGLRVAVEIGSPADERPVAVREAPVGEGGRTEVTVHLGEAARLWSDRDPFLYTAKFRLLQGGSEQDTAVRRFGLRTIRADGRRILLNGRPVYLRGYVDCCIFPLTGYPVWDKEHYVRQFQIAKSYGFNHVRLHGWTAPEPFWEAADETGMLVQAELPHWSWFYRDREQEAPGEVHRFLERELRRAIAMLGPHPSWVMLAMGNELIGTGGHPQLNELVRIARELDPTRLYTDNTGFGEIPAVGREGDFFIQSMNWHPPLKLDGTATPDTREDFRCVTKEENRPLIGHEHGQYTMYVRPEEARKYTGALRPSWLDPVLRSLAQKGLTDRVDDFIRASGTHMIRAMKENFERLRRTPGLSGFQYLDIRDFPGQGHAAIGILDVFWDSKGLIEPEAFRAFNGERVLLLRSAGRTVYAGEAIEAELELSHFGTEACRDGELKWRLYDDEKVYGEGTVRTGDIEPGGNTSLARIAAPTPPGKACALQLEATFSWEGGTIRNAWEFWSLPRPDALDGAERIYCEVEAIRPLLPGAVATPDKARLLPAVPQGAEAAITDKLTAGILQYLHDGGTVWLMAKAGGLYDQVTTRYLPPFWSFLWFPHQVGHTLGMIIEKHPALGRFPHDGYSNWIWYHLVDMAPAICTDAVPRLRPIVEVVDNFNRAKRLAYAFEARVGRGRLLVSSFRLAEPRSRKQPEAAFLTREIADYLLSEAFRPDQELTVGELLGLFKLEFSLQ